MDATVRGTRGANKTRNKRCVRNTRKKHRRSISIFIQQLKEVEQQFGALLRQLPSKSEMDALLSDINQAGLVAACSLNSSNLARSGYRDFYAELPVDVRVTGNYHDIGAFASDVSQLSRIVTLNDIAITNKDPKDMVLTMEAVARPSATSTTTGSRRPAQGQGCAEGAEEMNARLLTGGTVRSGRPATHRLRRWRRR